MRLRISKRLCPSVRASIRRSVRPSVSLWSGTTKNKDVGTGPLACLFGRSLAPLTHSLAPPCSLCSCAPLRSFICSLAHFAHSQARGKMSDLMSQYHIVLNHSAAVTTANTTITITHTKLKKIAIFCQFCYFCHVCLLCSFLGPIFLDS